MKCQENFFPSEAVNNNNKIVKVTYRSDHFGSLLAFSLHCYPTIFVRRLISSDNRSVLPTGQLDRKQFQDIFRGESRSIYGGSRYWSRLMMADLLVKDPAQFANSPDRWHKICQSQSRLMHGFCISNLQFALYLLSFIFFPSAPPESSMTRSKVLRTVMIARICQLF